MKLKFNINKKAMKSNFVCGIILLSVGTILELKNGISYILNDDLHGLNLNLREVDIVYGAEAEEKKQSLAISSAPTIPVKMTNQVDTSWGWPTSLNYRITSSYNNGHPAIDIITTDGNLDIYAASSGVVVTTSYKWDGGNYIIIQHDNGYYSLYCHLSSIGVSQGQRVNKGQVIGIMGTTGRSTGVHLHYSIWYGYPYYGSSHINPWIFY